MSDKTKSTYVPTTEVDFEISGKDTIAAIASAHGQGAVGVLRISGSEAAAVLARVFRGKGGAKFESHRMYYGEIVSADNETIDEVMVCFFSAPRSFTREDCVEIYAHGGMFVLGRLLEAVVAAGARVAEPGEFTKRAFLNGRINLAQAEAVMDLISSTNDTARRAALRQLGGGLSRRVEQSRDKILSWLAHIELSIDYPEHGDEAQNAAEILAEAPALISDMRGLLATANVGRVIREGIRTAIIGRPNVGKSTLLNAILHENRAIVHETAGTTRDVLTEVVRIGDVPLVLTDTAGLRRTADAVEKIGIEKSREAADDAELILYVADATEGLTAEDEDIISELKCRKIFVIFNKVDLMETVGADTKTAGGFAPRTPHPLFEKSGAKTLTKESRKCAILEKSFEGGSGETFSKVSPEVLYLSAKTADGLDELFSKIRDEFLAGGICAGGAEDIITRERHRELLSRAIAHVERAMAEISAGVPEDLASVELRAAYIALGEILGAEIGDDIVDRIFAEFCLGK